MPDSDSPRLLHFLAPGFLHGMGNALFAIQSHALVGSSGGRGEGTDTVAACGQAKAALEVFRFVAGESGDDDPVAAGSQLRPVADLLRIGLRDRNLRLDVEDAVCEVDTPVPRRTFVRGVVLAAERLTRAMPTGFRGTLQMTWPESGVLALEFAGEPGQLPFSADVEGAAAQVTELLARRGGLARGLESRRGLALAFPRETVDG